MSVPVQLQLAVAPEGKDGRQQEVSPPSLPPAIRPTIVFDTYWRFAAERQNIFFRRIEGFPPPWTEDPILREHKFTNAYRASDRVSQYLIRNVIYAGAQEPADLFFRILLFKIFNRIETWQLLQQHFGSVSLATYDFRRYDEILNDAMRHGRRIYSPAYIMPSGGRASDGRKHRMHLLLLDRMISDGVPQQLQQCESMQQGFEILRSYPTIGDFLAYQFITDINYSTLTGFSEMDFVIPGPGAKDGVRKCFESTGTLSAADVICMMADVQDEQFARLQLSFRSLWGRRLHLVDCQNLFCEVDKYARIFHPEITGDSGRKRIKQRFRPSDVPLHYWFPPKWNLNDKTAASAQLGSGLPSTGAGEEE